MIDYGCKIEEEVKAIKSEVKKNTQGTNSGEKETGTQINSLEQEEERNIQLEQNGETIIKKQNKTKQKLRNFQNNFKRSNIQLTGVPEGDEEEQETENLFEKIMKKNFPSLARIHTQVQEAQRVPKKLHPKRNTPRHIIIK